MAPTTLFLIAEPENASPSPTARPDKKKEDPNKTNDA
jgi:hypothetical protein